MYILDLNNIYSTLGFEYLSIEHDMKQSHKLRQKRQKRQERQKRLERQERKQHSHHHPQHYNHFLSKEYPYRFTLQPRPNINASEWYPNLYNFNCSCIPGCLYLSSFRQYQDLNILLFMLFMFIIFCSTCRKKRTNPITITVIENDHDKNDNYDKTDKI